MEFKKNLKLLTHFILAESLKLYSSMFLDLTNSSNSLKNWVGVFCNQIILPLGDSKNSAEGRMLDLSSVLLGWKINESNKKLNST